MEKPKAKDFSNFVICNSILLDATENCFVKRFIQFQKNSTSMLFRIPASILSAFKGCGLLDYVTNDPWY